METRVAVFDTTPPIQERLDSPPVSSQDIPLPYVRCLPTMLLSLDLLESLCRFLSLAFVWMKRFRKLQVRLHTDIRATYVNSGEIHKRNQVKEATCLPHESNFDW